eukprot:m.30110 g.30110  ORF g.30110 m.30110 type:complete len:498 (+) comp8172_c0_seq1:120-1613(+)
MPKMRRRTSVWDVGPVITEASTHNPFMNQTPDMYAIDWIQGIVMGLILPFKIIILLAVLIPCTLYVKLALLGWKPKDGPLSPWQEKQVDIIRSLARLLLFMFGFYQIRVKGKKASEDECRLLVCNHVSLLDPLFFVSQGYAQVSKASAAVPIFSDMFGTVLVNRKNKKSCEEVKAVIRARSDISGPKLGPPLAMYPEGTIGNGSSVLAFKLGAFLPGNPVQPAVIRYRALFFDPSWTYNCKYYFWRLVTQAVMIMEVEYLPVYHPSAKEKENPALFADNVRKQMAAALNVPVSNHALADVFLANEAKNVGLPKEVGIIEYQKFREKLNLSMKEIEQYMEKFSAIDVTKDGIISLEEFVEGFGNVIGKKTAKALFNKLDTNENGGIDFREFLAGVVFINDLISVEDTAKLTFRLLDTEKTGTFNELELHKLVQSLSAEPIEDADIRKVYNQMNNGKPVNESQFVEFLKKSPSLVSGPAKTTILEHFKVAVSEALTKET